MKLVGDAPATLFRRGKLFVSCCGSWEDFRDRCGCARKILPMQLCLDRLEFLRRITTSEARKLRIRGLIPASAEDDVVDELVFEVVVRLAKYDSSRGTWEAFVVVIVRSKLASILRRLLAAKRDFRREQSLGDRDVVDDSQGTASWHRAFDLRLDVEEALLALEESDRAFAVELASKSLAQVARDSGLSRRTIRERKDGLRGRLEEAGLDIYRNTAASSSADRVDTPHGTSAPEQARDDGGSR